MRILSLRFPVIATIIVAAALALMVGLGIWQLQRAEWKADLLAQYRQAADQPPLPWPVSTDRLSPPLYRQSSLNCASVTGWRAASGRNANGQSGWVHIATCRLGGDGQNDPEASAQVVAGWSNRPDDPVWGGGSVSGTIAPDSNAVIRLIAQPPVAGLVAVQPPSLDDIPNNHMAYAVQWFIFAILAAIIYILALRGAQRRKR